jgi:hypothetical protein
MSHSQARMLALQLEQLTKEASGFKSRLASLSDENTRLKRELKQRRGGAQSDSATLKKVTGELQVARRELRSLREQRDAEARRQSDQKIKVDAKLSQLSQELKAAQKERQTQDRRVASEAALDGRRDQQLKGTSVRARDQALELDRLRATLATRSTELADEETRRRRVEGDLASTRAQLTALEHKTAAMTKAMSLAKIQLQKQKNELEARQRTIQQLEQATPASAGGAYGDLILKAQSTIRSMAATPSAAESSAGGGGGGGGTSRRRGSRDSSSLRHASSPAPRRPATAGPRTPSAAAPSGSGSKAKGSSPTSALAMCLSEDLSGLLAGLTASPDRGADRSPRKGRRTSEGSRWASQRGARSRPDGGAGGGEDDDEEEEDEAVLNVPSKAARDALFDRFDANGPLKGAEQQQALSRAPVTCCYLVSPLDALSCLFDSPSQLKLTPCVHVRNMRSLAGNGGLSLAEIDKAVLELYPTFNNKPALMRAYKAADRSGIQQMHVSDVSHRPGSVCVAAA